MKNSPNKNAKRKRERDGENVIKYSRNVGHVKRYNIHIMECQKTHKGMEGIF